jgi:hypothetical protein
LIEETKELTEEEKKAEEDQFFVEATHPESMQRINQGGEFLEAGHPETMYHDEETAKLMVEEARSTFQKCAQIAALENSPGMDLILKQIDDQTAELHKDNENMMLNKKVDPNLMQANIFAAVKLQEFKAWIKSKQETYKKEVSNG